MRQVFYYKMRQFYYKMWQLLQKATFITNCDSTCSIKVVTRYQGKQVSLLSFERKGKQVRIQLPIQHLSEVKILKLLMFFTISN